MMPTAPNGSSSSAEVTLGSGARDLDGASLDLLYRRHAAWLRAVLRRSLGSLASDAEDLVHDTYIRIGQYAPHDRDRQPQALLRRIAVNLARDHMRRTVVRGFADPYDDDSGPADPRLSVAPTQDIDVELKRVVLTLPPRYRDVFMLSRFTRMSNEQIAAHFAISVKTVEWRLSKALAICTRYLED